MLTFASAFASNFNIASTVMLMLMQRMGIEPILCICVLLPLLLLFWKIQTQTRDAKCDWAFTISLMAYSDTACLGPGTILHQLKFSH